MQFWQVENSYEETRDKAQVLNAFGQFLAESESPEEDGSALVMLAAKYAHFEALEWLISQGVSLNATDRYNFTPLHVLAKAEWRYYTPQPDDLRRCVRLLLENGVSVLRKDENENMVCYHYAARSGRWDFVEELNGKKLDMTDKNGNTGIHIACDYVRHAMHTLKYSDTLVERAVTGFEETKARLLDRGETMETVYDYMKFNLIKTPEEAQAEYDAIVDHVDDYYKVVKAFVDGGVDPDEKNDYGRSALDIAVEYEAKKLAAYLSGEDVESGSGLSTGGMSIHQAVEKGDLDAIKAIAESGGDLNGINDRQGRYFGYTPLAIACAFVNVEALELLAGLGADVNAKDNDGHTALYYIAREAYDKSNVKKAIETLKNAGYDINSFVDDDSNTLLNYCCKSGPSCGRELIEPLMKLGADLNIANRFGETPLMAVCKDDHPSAENTQIIMLENGADVCVKDINGNTPLHWAAQNRSNSMAKTMSDMLFEFGKVDANAVNNEEKSALDIASGNENEPLVKYLLGKL